MTCCAPFIKEDIGAKPGRIRNSFLAGARVVECTWLKCSVSKNDSQAHASRLTEIEHPQWFPAVNSELSTASYFAKHVFDTASWISVVHNKDNDFKQGSTGLTEHTHY